MRRWRARAASVAAATPLLVALALTGLVTGAPSVAGGTTIGSVSGFGDASSMGSPAASQLAAPLVGMAATPDGKGYWLVGADGGVFTYGDAGFFGSRAATGPTEPIVGMAATPDGKGYWLATDRGWVAGFGDATPAGTGPMRLNAPIVGITATPTGKGYWLAAADGGVFSFGSARFYGSMGGTPLNQPIVGIAATPTGKGYWLAAADGGVFSFGSARFYGSMGGTPLNQPIVGIAATTTGNGYWLAAADGGIFTFGHAPFLGSLGATPPGSGTPVVGVAADPAAPGYWLTTTDRSLPPDGPVPSVLDYCNVATSAPHVRPGRIMLACGDGNAYLNNLTWSSWTSSRAAATGDYTHNLCQPDCADGRFVSVPATIRLSYPVETSAGLEFAELSYAATGSTFRTAIPTTPY